MSESAASPLTAVDLAEAMETVAEFLEVEPTEAQVRAAIEADLDLLWESKKWGWNETVLRENLCDAVEAQQKA